MSQEKEIKERISDKLIQRINNLSVAASKESIQTLVKWILFHVQNHPNAIQQTLYQFVTPIQDNTNKSSSPSTHILSSQYRIAWNIIHELCLAHSPSSILTTPANTLEKEKEKWTATSSFRETLGETVIQPGLEAMQSSLCHYYTQTASDIANLSLQAQTSFAALKTLQDKIVHMGQMWQEENSFDSPTFDKSVKRLIGKISNECDISSQVSNEPLLEETNKEQEVPVDFETNETNDDDVDMQETTPDASIEKEVSQEQNEETEPEEDKLGSTEHSTLSASTFGTDVAMQDSDKEDTKDNKENSTVTSVETIKKEEDAKLAEFDFDAFDIPEEKVSIHELSVPCKSIATLQITRDLRNDTSHNLSTILAAIPDTVLDTCRSLPKDVSPEDIPLVEGIPDDVLDLDVKSSISNVVLHKEIIQKQKQFRQKCIELLIKSRCKFGSTDAAELFYSLDEVEEKLKKRKAMVLDAMELEGLDYDLTGKSNDSRGQDNGDDDQLKDFEWFKRSEVQAKKQKGE